MKKSVLLSIASLLFIITANAQIEKDFALQIKALLEAGIEKIKGEKDEKSVSTAYQSTLQLTGFKVLLKETFGDYRVSCIYKGTGSVAMMDTIAEKLSKSGYILIDSKKQPKILELDKNGLANARKILLVDIAENIKADISLSDGAYPTLSITIYKYNRKLFKE